MADVVEIHDPEQLEQYRLMWNSLLPRTPRASFFHTFDWFRLYWKHFGQQQNMRVLVVRALGAPIGIVPLCVHRRRYRVGNVRVLSYPLDDWGMWYGPIGPHQSASMFMALKHLRETPRDWDLLDLRWTPAEHTDHNATGRALRATGWRPHKSAYQQASIVRMDHDWDHYLASKSSKWRTELRRQLRVVERAGDVEFVRYRPAGVCQGDGDPRWDLFDACRELAAVSWQGQSTTGNTLSHEPYDRFLRDCHQASAKLGMLDVSLLKLDGRPVAFAYNYHYDGNVYGLRMGYDPRLSNHGLGKALLARTLQDSFARGDRQYDLGVGEYEFKRRFRTDVETSYRYTCYPRLALRSQSVRFSQWLKQRFAPQAALPDTKVRTA